VDMMKWQKENSVMAAKAETMSPEELKGKLVIGMVQELDYPEYTEEYQKIIDRFKK